MKVMILIVVLCLITTLSYSDECYVFLHRHTEGDNEKGDVIDVVCDVDYKPDKRDYINFDIIKMELTKAEAEDMREPLYVTNASIDNGFEIEKPRKYKIDSKTLNKASHGQTNPTVYTKQNISSVTTLKTATISAINP